MREELEWIAEAMGAREVVRGERVQSLWSGYGEIVRVHLLGAEMETAIVKAVQPPTHERRGPEARSHARKCRSYEVEAQFYRTFAPRCDATCRVARLYASRRGERGAGWLLVLEDLDAAGYSERRQDLGAAGIEVCLSWLASFHARFFGVAPEGLWKTGTYWHLGTRPDELERVRDAALRTSAPELDRRLREARHQTFVHGDAKPANFCFAERASDVGAVDFQYVGGGVGVKDVAYLLEGERGASERWLDVYFRLLRAALAREHPTVDADDVEREWRALFPVARADFHRFMAGWAPGL